MIKNLAIFCTILATVFGFEKAQATEVYPFLLQRQDGTFLEGYYSPPNQADSPIIFAIQGSGCESVLPWYTELCDQMSPLGVGIVALEKQGISQEKIDLFTYQQTNSLQQRQEDYELCLENMHRICPDWTGKCIFWSTSEGGTLAAHLATLAPQTSAVLLFGTGGGMQPREEVKWAIRHQLEQQKALQSEIDSYMHFLDEQLDAMLLDPTPHKEFLGNTYKWWASFLSAEEIVQSLNHKSLPIFLIHGVEDNHIPIQSADLAAEILKESDALTYLRLQGYGHDLDTAEIHQVACQWLATILSGQKPLESSLIVQITNSAPALEDEGADAAEYVFSRGKPHDKGKDKNDKEKKTTMHGSIHGSGGSDKQYFEGEVGASHEFGNGYSGELSVGGSGGRDRNGNVGGELHGELRLKKGF